MEDILSELPETEVVGDVGRNQSFEVSINGQLVFSKLKTYGFPKAQDIIKEIQRASQGEKCQEITDSESPWCVLL
ncbi:MIEN1-like protein [Mya arenaria]|nr:migration and invasion enhancer 1-like [Mya arenaria]XP_052785863.1 migration and invasion enhancer 1-like [Mya arenaria]XP_052786516.1 migration and invasion enhancer 1-like [Mya arenaria]XP_052787420.1 migration and invasion enhancer 1-like [Mya arenaria]XP_052787720.1 migration and invasion enhancer 1-like [Mya arenaria]WAR29324.1 MIEN1-like protein [Mya arenaria]WAR29348.1 MIEN1-like protein [Mya arenaria]